MNRLKLGMLVLLAAACGGAPNTSKVESRSCDISAEPQEADLTFQILYSASKSGDATVTQLKYLSSEADAGEVIVDSPTLPWSKTVTVSAGQSAGIKATGSVKDGKIDISFFGTARKSLSGGGSIDETLSGADSCNQTITNTTK